MNKFPQNIRFKYPWRDYQNRILSELQSHFSDKNLHVIAPPGSGKTVLGLEVALRLNQPTLIIAPTIAIRDQWVERFVELFLQSDITPDWVSLDIRNPKFLTCTTYQGLYSACTSRTSSTNSEKNEDEYEYEEMDEEMEQKEIKSKKQGSQKTVISSSEFSTIVEKLKEQGVKSIVVDEAHHLKNSWWSVVIGIKKELKPILVALTATPPYDVNPQEWRRYIELCGTVDVEINAPELVKDSDLCPHQDYVYLSQPEEDEIDTIIQYRKDAEKYYNSLLNDERFIQMFEEYDVWKEPNNNLEWIYSNLETYLSIYILIRTAGRKIARKNSKVFGLSIKSLTTPMMSYARMSILLNFCITKERKVFSAHDVFLKNLEKDAIHTGLLENKKISLEDSSKVALALRNSIGKLKSIVEITKCEHSNLKDKLRMVILTDYIRKEYIVSTADNNLDLTNIGVMSIFEKLRREIKTIKRIAVLTGSIVILTKELVGEIKNNQASLNLDATELPYDNNFCLVQMNNQTKVAILSIVTQSFINGKIEVLIGTKSLLGEGWDAPCINVLIMASFVGSFVSSNQMRGRAIRIERGNIHKSGNIWHLACVDPTQANGGYDIEILTKRFSSFVGISFDENSGIESGISRLNIPKNFRDRESVALFNTSMLEHSCRRELLDSKWKKAISSGKILLEEIKIPYSNGGKSHDRKRKLYLYKTMASLFAMSSSGFIYNLMRSSDDIQNIVYHIEHENRSLVAFGIIFLLFLLSFGRYLILFINHRDIAKDIEDIGYTVLETLCKRGNISTNINDITFVAIKDIFGGITCHLENVSAHENISFLNCIEDIISPIKSPRYILKRDSLLYIFNRSDYYSVPETLGLKKSVAVYFSELWQYRVGGCKLIYTRTIAGRRALLKARMNSLSFGLLEKDEKDKYLSRYNKWC